MSENADVIVIGGGIHGCSTALHLALRGARVTLLEKDYPGRHSSGVNAGGVRQLARHIAEVPISVFSMALWERIEELVDDDCGFASHGQVLVAESEEELAQFRARVDELRLHGFTHEELIDRAELKRLVPAVSDYSDRPRRAEAAGAGGLGLLPGGDRVAPRRRRRSVPHHAGVSPQGGLAWRARA